MNPYCKKNCGHLVPIKNDKNKVTMFWCTMFEISRQIIRCGGQIKRDVRYTELEFDDGLVLKCPACMRSVERIGGE